MNEENSAPKAGSDEPVDFVHGSDSGHETGSRQVADSDSSSASGNATELSKRRRRGHRRVTGGRAPDPNLAVNDPALSARPSDPDRAASGASDAMSDWEHELWLKEQRPPHWG